MYGMYYDVRDNLSINSINRGITYRTSVYLYEKNLQNQSP